MCTTVWRHVRRQQHTTSQCGGLPEFRPSQEQIGPFHIKFIDSKVLKRLKSWNPRSHRQHKQTWEREFTATRVQKVAKKLYKCHTVYCEQR